MDRILVGVNGSPASIAAAALGADEAAIRNAELTMVPVLAASSRSCTQTDWPSKPSPNDITNTGVAQGEQVIDDALDAVAKEIRRRPPRITSRLCLGSVVPTLWEFTQADAQMIELGRRSRDKPRRAGLSSRALLGHSRHDQLVVVRGTSRGSLVAGGARRRAIPSGVALGHHVRGHRGQRRSCGLSEKK
jgi:nucleotide-binding universal stress UspA family protein